MSDSDNIEPTIRRGSPFATASSPPSEPPTDASGSKPAAQAIGDPQISEAPFGVSPELFVNGAYDIGSVTATLDVDWGVLKAAIWASAWSLIFVVACSQVFPGGGVCVAALGCSLAVIGLFSSKPIPAIVLLAVHAAMFFVCYSRMLTG